MPNANIIENIIENMLSEITLSRSFCLPQILDLDGREGVVELAMTAGFCSRVSHLWQKKGRSCCCKCPHEGPLPEPLHAPNAARQTHMDANKQKPKPHRVLPADLAPESTTRISAPFFWPGIDSVFNVA